MNTTFTPKLIDPAQLPDFLPISLVSVITGLAVATIRDHVKKGTFPQPVRISPKKHFWKKTELFMAFPELQR